MSTHFQLFQPFFFCNFPHFKPFPAIPGIPGLSSHVQPFQQFPAMWNLLTPWIYVAINKPIVWKSKEALLKQHDVMEKLQKALWLWWPHLPLYYLFSQVICELGDVLCGLHSRARRHNCILYSPGPVLTVLVHRMGIWSHPLKNGLIQHTSKINFVFLYINILVIGEV